MKAPLTGTRVVVTRAAHQAQALCRLLSEAGARVEALPLLEMAPPEDPEPLRRAIADLDRFRWLAFSSANGVRAFVQWLGRTAPETLAGIRVAAVGPATAAAAREAGLRIEVEAARAHAAGLAAELAPSVGGETILIPQAADARPDLLQGLLAAGARPHAVVTYDKRLPAGAAASVERVFADGPMGWVTFTSPRIVRHFVGLLGEPAAPDWKGLRALSIGPVTSRELRRQEIEPAAEARCPEDSEMVRVLAEKVRSEGE